MRVRQTPEYRAAMKRLTRKRQKRRIDKEIRKSLELEAMEHASQDTTVKGRGVQSLDTIGSEGETYLLQEGKSAEEDNRGSGQEEEVKEGHDWVDGYFRKKRDKS